MSTKFALIVIALCFAACTRAGTQTNDSSPIGPQPTSQTVEKNKNSAKVIHVLVALCDNENQGIVPVPAHLGNGEDPNRNL
jgi:hypothetical protein